MTGILPSLDQLKTQAKALRKLLAAEGRDVGHGHALELVAKSLGFRDWNTLHAAAGNAPRPPVAVGQVVAGRYLKQPFSARVKGVQSLSGGRYQLLLDFDEPVDVVTFDSFSNFRRRVTSVVDRDGRSRDRTSDGVPHMELSL